MAKKAYGQRYAQAVFELALERKELDSWQADLEKIGAAVQNKEFLAALESPKIGFDVKAKLLTEGLPGLNPLALNLMYLLISRSEVSLIGDIAAGFRQLLDEHRGIATAEVITAVPLDESDKKKLAENLGEVVGKQVVLQTEVDPEIIGGIIARVGGKLLDGSTRSKLAALKKELVGSERKR